MWGAVLVLVVAGAVAEHEDGVKTRGFGARVFRNEPSSPKYWRAIDGSVHKEGEAQRTSKSDADDSLIYPDKVQVVSSALRILPRKKKEGRRSRRDSEGSSWRVPREYHFVTRDERPRSARLVEPYKSPSNLYPEERSFYGDERFNRRNLPLEPQQKSSSPPNRRIIYYATLPEVVRRPGEWTPPRPIGYPPPAPLRGNELTRVHSPIIDVTRVQSSLIDVTAPKDKYPQPSNYNAPSQDLSKPTFTIIDAEPPYRQPPPLPGRYDRGRYEQDRYDAPRFEPNRYEQNRYEPPRYDRNYYDYNRYDYNRFYVDPYRYHDEARYPPHRQVLVQQPITVVRKPLDVRPFQSIRPLDVRPLDPIQDATTQSPQSVSSSTTTTKSPSSTTTPNPISSFERTFKY